MILFFFTFIGIIFELTISFYTDYPIKTISVSPFGKVHVEFGLRSGTFRTGYYACDAGAAYPYYKCDPMIHEIVIVTGNVTSDMTTDVQILEKDFTSQFSKFNEREKWKSKEYFISDSYFKFISNVDYYNHYEPHFYDSDHFYKVVGICSQVYDDDAFGKEYLIGFCKFLTFYEHQSVLHYIKTRLESKLDYEARVKCQKNYFELSCWRKCEPEYPRFICDSNGYEICIENFEGIKIIYYYQMHTFNYIGFYTVYLTLNKCIIFNYCYNKRSKSEYKCPEDFHLCYPTGNTTFSCASFHHKYIISSFPGINNVTFESLLNTENVQFTFLFKGETPELLKNHSTCTWTYPYNKKYISFSTLKNGLLLTYPIHIAYGIYYFTIKCILGEFRTINYYRTYTIHVIPTNFKLFNLSLGNDEVIYIGQTIRCQSNAVPQDRSVHMIILKSKNFIPPKTFYELYIPITSITGFCSIECIHFFRYLDNREQENITKLLFHEIKSYVYFKWRNEFKNQYTIYDTTGCIYQVYFDGYIVIDILEGKSKFKLDPYDNFTLRASNGGKYVLLCRLSDDDNKIYFLKSKTIEISFEPTLFCLMPYFATPGSIIKFAHNGHPPDEVNIAISLFVNGDEVSFTKVTYIKIPYEVNNNMLLLLGKITFTLKSRKSTVKVNKEIILLHETRRVVSITQKDFMCAELSEYEIRYHQLSDKALQFDAEVMVLMKSKKIWIELLYCFYLFPLFGMVFLIYATKRIKTNRSFEIRRKAIKYRFLNDLMAHRLRQSGGAEVAFNKQFSRLHTLQDSSDEL